MPHLCIVPRSSIPPLASGDGLHGALRDLHGHEQLRSVLPAQSTLSAKLLQLRAGEVLSPQRLSGASLLVFFGGSGRITGDLAQPVSNEDVVVASAGCSYGIVGGAEGLLGLLVEFGADLPTLPLKAMNGGDSPQHTLESVLELNERRAKQFESAPIFQLLTEGTLEDPAKRQAYLDALQIWVNGNQTLLVSRQACCSDDKYADMFLRHMKEELGHDAMHEDRAEQPAPERPQTRDAVMEAITNWFALQMYVLDNAEKTALIHLVIERASAIYHARAMPFLSKYVNQEYFDVHVENDDEHAAMGVALLRDETPRSYERMTEIVSRGWDMIEAMTSRVTEIARA